MKKEKMWLETHICGNLVHINFDKIERNDLNCLHDILFFYFEKTPLFNINAIDLKLTYDKKISDAINSVRLSRNEHNRYYYFEKNIKLGNSFFTLFIY
jgi:hypothetical protein